MSEKLKACPFCNGEAELRAYTGTLQFVQCRACGASSRAYETGEEAVEAWNKRYSFFSEIKKYCKELMKSWVEN